MERNPVKQTMYTLKEEAKLMTIHSEIRTQQKGKKITHDSRWQILKNDLEK